LISVKAIRFRQRQQGSALRKTKGGGKASTTMAVQHLPMSGAATVEWFPLVKNNITRCGKHRAKAEWPRHSATGETTCEPVNPIDLSIIHCLKDAREGLQKLIRSPK
jgi:hypothetical protein